ncbi:hypothetical protein HanRHA438_Chr11g0480621 [Helianthus annuus]|nr:hypothetical protein HanRHA438_Chr11g0480621 [Helianthus annuus]
MREHASHKLKIYVVKDARRKAQARRIGLARKPGPRVRRFLHALGFFFFVRYLSFSAYAVPQHTVFAPRRALFGASATFFQKKPIFAPRLPPGAIGAPRCARTPRRAFCAFDNIVKDLV